jgi:hypothetical protein
MEASRVHHAARDRSNGVRQLDLDIEARRNRAAMA